ncbi:ACP S-malonyltransferase [Algisphaera agarilytica]|uniref:Malonyl CoA-acyl carrier protein transacylase n=1 Tax=Algisphaera agarilytica TaxID=1385975 RepID=A0A7X0LK41_9BACT|nr:ACP S-malonyltransferase [Algisphaera agarilytica]MBB6428568.1 [acyl-carrier-protein] S-malonyltransferase [Algisphaera agarilytica]
MSDQTTLLCPGQGAQAVGMGKGWFDAFPVAAQTFAAADDALGFSLSGLCFEGPAEQLNRTDMAQCAIYTASVACFQALLESGEVGTFTATAGLSLGEFTALHLAGAYDFVEGLNLVKLRGQAMQDAAEASEGSMVAVTGDVTEDAINELCDKARGDSVLVPANFNSPMQVVVSGSVDACERAVDVASEMGFKPTPLTVAGAFHSPLMQPAADRLSEALDKVQWNTPNVPVISNVTGEPHDINDVDSIKANLVAQLTSPVRWSQSMQWAAANLPGRYVELAPGKVLSGLMRRIDRGTKVENFNEPK